MKRRIVSLLLASVMLVSCLTGCGGKETDSNINEEQTQQESESEIETEIEKVQFLEFDALMDMIVEAGYTSSHAGLHYGQAEFKEAAEEITENGMTLYKSKQFYDYFGCNLPQTIATIKELTKYEYVDERNVAEIAIKGYRIDILQGDNGYNIVYREQSGQKGEDFYEDIKVGQMDEETLVAFYNQKSSIYRNYKQVSSIEEIIDRVAKTEGKTFPGVTEEELPTKAREWLVEAILENGKIEDLQSLNLPDEEIKTLFMLEPVIENLGYYTVRLGTNEYHKDEHRAYTLRKIVYETPINDSMLEFKNSDAIYNIFKTESGQYVLMKRVPQEKTSFNYIEIVLNIYLFDDMESLMYEMSWEEEIYETSKLEEFINYDGN